MVRCLACKRDFEGVQALKAHNAVVEPQLGATHAPFYMYHRFVDQDGEQTRATEWKRELGEHDGDERFDFGRLCTETVALLPTLMQEAGYPRRFSIKFHVVMSKVVSTTDEMETIEPYFSSTLRIVYDAEELREQIPVAVEQIFNQMGVFTQEGSGWSHLENKSASLLLAEYAPRRVGCNTHKLPKVLRKLKSIGKIQAHDEKCFQWSVLASLHGCHIKSRDMTKKALRPYVDRYQWPPTFPVTLRQVDRFCRDNPQIAIHVLMYCRERASFFPLRFDDRPCEHVVDLLLVDSHFYHITNYNALLDRTNNYHGHFCRNCLSRHTTPQTLAHHLDLCRRHGEAKVVMPTPSTNLLTFTDQAKTVLEPFVMAVDTESMLSPDVDVQLAYRKHLISSYSLILVESATLKVHLLCEGFGPDAGTRLIADLKRCLDYVTEHLEHRPLHMTADNWTQFNAATQCFLCKRDFGSTCYKCRHHCHLTAAYLGAACGLCNLKAKWSHTVPCLVHSLPYDCCHIIRHLSTLSQRTPFIIAPSNEKIRFIKFAGQITFCDTVQYVNTSLRQLVQEHKASGLPFHVTRQVLGDDMELISRKSVFPYLAMRTWADYEAPCLPLQLAFTNDDGEPLSDADYAHAQHVFHTTHCHSMRDYNAIYNRLDTALLLDCILQIRLYLYQQYMLDLVRFPSLPSFSWSAALLYTNARLLLPTDVAVYLFLEQYIRGGICGQSVRYVRANNACLPTYDATRPTSHLLYFDIRALYSTIMSKFKLPSGGYNFVTDVSLEEILATPDDADHGYIIQCAVTYPHDVKAATVDLPLLATHHTVTYAELSEFQQRQVDTFALKTGQAKKLLMDHRDQEHYILDYRLAKFLVAKGLHLHHLETVLAFQQDAFLAPYVDNNHRLRIAASTDTWKTMHKSLNNQVFGKSITNQRKQKNIKLVLSPKAYDRHASKMTVKNIRLLGDNVALLEHTKDEIHANLPTAVGTTILDLSKLWFFRGIYDGFKRHFSNCYVCYVDTDGGLLYVVSERYEEELKALQEEYLDGSNMSGDLRDMRFDNCLGRFRDELPNTTLHEMIALRSKMYSLQASDRSQVVCKAKGIARAAKRQLTHDQYARVLRDNTHMFSEVKQIRTIDFVPYSVTMTKKSLSAYDDKRFQVDAVRSVPHGCPPTLVPSLSYFNADQFLNKSVSD